MPNLDVFDIGILIGVFALSAGYFYWKSGGLESKPAPAPKMTLAELK
jgi:hypothetical protein